MQARLLVAGHDPRGVDGVFGPGTRAALKAWQGAQGLQATGYLDAAALDLLERRTESAYAAWVERQRAERAARRPADADGRAERKGAADTARRTALDRAGASSRAARAGSEAAGARGAPHPAPAISAPAPNAAADNPLSTPARSGGSARERYEQDCYFVTTGTTDLKRICE